MAGSACLIAMLPPHCFTKAKKYKSYFCAFYHIFALCHAVNDSVNDMVNVWVLHHTAVHTVVHTVVHCGTKCTNCGKIRKKKTFFLQHPLGLQPMLKLSQWMHEKPTTVSLAQQVYFFAFVKQCGGNIAMTHALPPTLIAML
jgi:hypothetical protein